MSVEAARGSKSGAQWGAPLAGPRGAGGERIYAPRARRRAFPRDFSEARGPAASMRRDTIFRRSLLVADATAILAALTLTVVFSERRVPLHLTWESMVGVPLQPLAGHVAIDPLPGPLGPWLIQ